MKIGLQIDKILNELDLDEKYKLIIREISDEY